MAETELTRQVGARMRQAAEEKGYKQAEVAEMIGRPGSTVSRWWSGEHTPEKDDMVQYAETVGVSEAWLWTGREELTQERLFEAVAAVLTTVVEGEAPSKAWDALTHEPWFLTPERRQLVDGAAGAMRAYVNEHLPQWAELTAYERRQAMLRLLGQRR